MMKLDEATNLCMSCQSRCRLYSQRSRCWKALSRSVSSMTAVRFGVLRNKQEKRPVVRILYQIFYDSNLFYLTDPPLPYLTLVRGKASTLR